MIEESDDKCVCGAWWCIIDDRCSSPNRGWGHVKGGVMPPRLIRSWDEALTRNHPDERTFRVFVDGF